MNCNAALLLLSLLATLYPINSADSGCDRSLASVCGQPAVQPTASRVVGGHEAPIGAWPWTVALTELDTVPCGGGIINDRVILTAAHCFEDMISRNASRWKVLAGKHHLFKTDRGEMTFTVEKIVMHEHFIHTHTKVDNDIALLIVRERIPFTTLIRPICVPDGSANTALSTGQPCLMAGWGDTKGTAPQNVLNEVMVPVVSDSLCGSPGWYGHAFFPQKTFCAGYESGGKDSCSGDSGGPLITRFNNRWYVVGIGSWGYGCAEPAWPGVYTSVTHYLPWIRDTMAANGQRLSCSDSTGDIIG